MDDIFEEIFDEKATDQVPDWNLQQFKMENPKIYIAIIEAMKSV